MKQIGYVLSGCDQSRISFVVMEDSKVYVNNYYFINHPSSLSGEFNPVLLRVYKITPYNPEMTIGSFGPIAGKKGEKAYYGKKLEYLVAWAEVLGYISWDGKWRRLECSPNTWDLVYEPTYEELEGFFIKLSSKSLSDRADFSIAIGRHRGLNIPFHLDLNAIAKGHIFVAGMSVDYAEPLIYMVNGIIHIEKIGEFVDRFFADDSEGSIPVEGVYIPSFNPETYEVGWRPVAEVIRHRYAGVLVRIFTETGRSITVTPGHSVFVLRDGEVSTIPASEIRVGDYLVAPSEIPMGSRPVTEIDILEVLGNSSDNRSIYLHNVPESVYERFDEDNLWFKGDRGLRLRWRRKKILPIRYARLLMFEEKTSIKIAARRGIEIPAIIKVDEEFARLMGYYVAKGNTRANKGRSYNVVFNLGLNDLDIIEDIRRIISRLTVSTKVSVIKNSSSYRIIIYDKVLTLLFRNLAPGNAR
ncbi:hypothetical protein KEJ48_07235, partial [Candidatus Bathyarchaeota archaeon]|nr:hypothetical protein [Candidatus Bathyarchaeota archaeon]